MFNIDIEKWCESLRCEDKAELYLTLGIIGGFAGFVFVQFINMLAWAF